MAIKKKAKKKEVSRKPAAKTAKGSPKKKKTATKKTTSKKKAVTKTTKKKAAKPSLPKKQHIVEPGPPPSNIPSVEEPATHEEAIGTVTHYFSHLNVAIVQINKGILRTGDKIHIKGHTTDIIQDVESMEYEHRHIDEASAGQSVGIKITDHAREHDIVFLVK